MGTDSSKPQQSETDQSVHSFHEALVRERKQDFDDIFEVCECIGQGGLCSIYRIRKRKEQIGGSSRPQHVRRKSWLHHASPIITGQRKTDKGTKEHPAVKVHQQIKLASNASVGSLESLDSNPSSKQMNFALKVINLAMVKEDKIDQLQNEIELLKKFDHPNIITAHETFKLRANKKLMIVMELCTGGDLFSRMPYTEDQVSWSVKQILSAVGYLHEKRIVHRDLKLENIMYESTHPFAAIKLIDFGMSKAYSPTNHILTERVGTLYSMSPETLQGTYTRKADLWSVGVCIFMMLSNGDKPFDGKTPKQLVAKILVGNFDFEAESWAGISALAKDFIRRLLVREPGKRLTAMEALNHEWVNQSTVRSRENGNFEERRKSEDMRKRVAEGIVRYSNMGDFRKLALNVIAKKSTSDEIFEIRKVFDEFDTLNTGTLTLPEFKQALAHFGYSDEDIMEIFRRVDVNKNNVVNYTEFLAAALETQGVIEEHRLAEAFDHFDSDDSGYISKKNLRAILGKCGDDDYIERIMKEVNPRKDGKISYEEFRRALSEKKHGLVSALYERSGSFGDAEALDSTTEDEVLRRFGIIGSLGRKVTSALTIKMPSDARSHSNAPSSSGDSITSGRSKRLNSGESQNGRWRLGSVDSTISKLSMASRARTKSTSTRLPQTPPRPRMIHVVDSSRKDTVPPELEVPQIKHSEK